MDLILRPVRAADRAFLLHLFTEARPDLAALPLPEGARQQMIDLQFDAQSRGYAQAFPRASHDIVHLDGRDVGQLRLDRGAEALHLVDLSVLSDVRGQGLGARLLRGIQQEATTANQPVRLSVQHGNPAAGLYRRMGFVATGDTGVHLTMEWCP
ncbi:GNAT family N-acetyltransferase [Antarctobacter sp.]|uniref:GNAT family N-acetyltransferase n=1 Tax=Antarctobacter sp. TaxID=1872577 RepID=UPI002B272484|nr:GNAT family N-acetyltransferase [Antarctobacter sp.]